MPLSETAADAAISFNKVTVKRSGNLILDRVSAAVPQGSCTAIVGPNGAGKTTLLLSLLGEIDYEGTIRISKANGKKRLRLGYVPQKLSFDRGMPLTVLEFMVMGRQRLPLWFGVKRCYRDPAMALLESVSASHLVKRRLGALSGGEMQRVLLAQALGEEPDLLVLDEPAAGVDLRGEHLFCELLEKIRSEKGFTQLMVSHDLSTVTHHASHVVALNGTVIAEGPPGRVLSNDTLTALFGLHMGLVARNALPGAENHCSCDHCHPSPNKEATDSA